MSTTYTTNYHLGKQTDTSDTFDMSVITDNMDIIDTQMKSNENDILFNKSNIMHMNCGYDDISVLGNFAIGGLNIDGSLKPSEPYRVSSTNTIAFDNDTTFIIDPDYNVGYIPYTNGSAGTWSGWFYGKISIPANTVLKFQIKKKIENTSITANIKTYTEAVALTSKSSISNFQYGNGTIEANGNDNVHTYMIPIRLLTSFINVANIDKILVSINDLYKYGWHTYDEKYTPIDNASEFINDTIELDVSNAHYVRFNFRKSNEGEISPSDAVEMNFKITNVAQFSNNSLTYSYYGTVNIGNTYSVKNYATYTPTSSSLPSTTQQGMSIYNGKAFLLYNKGGLAIYDLIDKQSIAEITLASASADNHCNSANFSTEFASGGVYPLLYISECYGQHRCFVEDVTNSGSTLIQTITFSNENGDYANSTYSNAFDWILDNDTNMLMTYGLMSDGKHKIKRFAKPDTSNATVTLRELDVIDEWIVEDYIYPALSSNYIYQGNCAKGGIIYLLAWQNNEIICIDENTHAITARIPLSFDSSEEEDIAIYANTMFVVYTSKKIYGLSFD